MRRRSLFYISTHSVVRAQSTGWTLVLWLEWHQKMIIFICQYACDKINDFTMKNNNMIANNRQQCLEQWERKNRIFSVNLIDEPAWILIAFFLFSSAYSFCFDRWMLGMNWAKSDSDKRCEKNSSIFSCDMICIFYIIWKKWHHNNGPDARHPYPFSSEQGERSEEKKRDLCDPRKNKNVLMQVLSLPATSIPVQWCSCMAQAHNLSTSTKEQKMIDAIE